LIGGGFLDKEREEHSPTMDSSLKEDKGFDSNLKTSGKPFGE
jgi:hypothetical protein